MADDDDLLPDNMVIPTSSRDDEGSHKTFIVRKRSAQQTQNTPLPMKKKPAATLASVAKGKTKVGHNQEDEDEDYVPLEEPIGAIKKVWMEKDEITLLKALKKQTNKSDMTALYDSVKTCLEADASKRQLRDKVRKLRNKFTAGNNINVEGLDDHQAKVVKLCQQIWGDDVDACGNKHDYVVGYPRVESCIDDMYGHGAIHVLRKCMAHLSRKELDEMEDELLLYHFDEIELASKRMVQMEKVSKLAEKATKAYKSNKH